MKILPLADVCDFLDSMRRPVTAKDRVSGVYPYYGANGILDYVDKYLFDEELVLLAEDGGYFDDPKRGVAYRVSGKCWVNNHAHVLRPKKNIDVDYLGYMLKQYDIRPYITGATVKKLTQKAARQIKIPLPPLEDQRRIVAILDKAVALHEKREQAIELLDEYLKSVFLEMFGDPMKNPKGWEIAKLEKVINYIKYGTSTPPVFSDAGKRFIRATNINKGKISDEGIKFISEEEASKITKCKLHAGDFIVVRSGVNAGDSAVVAEKYHGDFAGYDLIIRFNESVDPVFIGQMFLSSYLEKRIKPLTRRAAQPHINSDQVKQLKVILPPKKLQANFSEIVRHTETLKQTMFAQSEELEKQFHVLMQKAFKSNL